MNIWWWGREIHSSTIVAISCLGVLSGVFVAKYGRNCQWGEIIVFLVAISLFVLGLAVHKIYIIPVALAGGLLLGLWRGTISVQELQKYELLYNHTVVIKGTLSDDADTNTSDQAVLRLGDIRYSGQNMAGLLWVTTSSGGLERGDTVTLRGEMTNGFGNFAGVIYRANIVSVTKPNPPDQALRLRNWFADGVKKVIDEPESSLGIGYLTGQRRTLPSDLVTALQIVGLTHVVVASGYNLTILVRLARRAFVKISKYLATASAVVMIFGFIAITGASPSMVRAGLVSIFSLLAWYYGRDFHPLVLLLLTMALTVLLNPGYLWGDLGWQLSFAAFGGVMILAPLMQKYFWGDKSPTTVGQILVETISAQVVTMPIIVLAFGRFSNIALLANLLILPFVPLAMLLTFVAGIAGLCGGFVVLLAWPARILLGYMIKTIDILADIPWASSEIKISWMIATMVYIGIGVLCVGLAYATHYRLREVNIVE